MNCARMFAHMPPKERAVYLVLLSIFLFGAGYVGAQRLRQPPKIEIDVPKGMKLGMPSSDLSLSASPAGQTSASEVVVDVVGAVRSPGLQHLRAGARIDDAVKAAGGATSDADLEAVNLAAKLEDGQQVVVPRKGEAAASAGSAPAKGGKHPDRPINLGSASIAELEELPGVGPAMADKLMRYRLEHGRLTFEDLRAIPGLGPKRLEQIKPWVR